MIPRHISPTIRTFAKEFKIVAILGPRQSGKTTLVRSLFDEKPYVNLEELDQRRLAEEDPRAFLARFPEGAVIDEAQRAPGLFSYLQTRVDASKKRGQFILTGSQHIGLMEAITQTLAGRVGTVNLLPFSFAELHDVQREPRSLENALFYGGYPPLHDEPAPDVVRWLNAYIHTYVERDVRRMLNIRDLSVFQRFIGLCAGNAGQLLNTVRIGNDCGVSHNTVRAWLSVLEAGFVVHLLRPHHENFRKRLVKTPKICFYDTGLLVRLLGVETSHQLQTHPLRGAIFENWVFTELTKSFANSGTEPQLYFWRDNTGHEVDILRDSGAGLDAWECKSGATYVPEWVEDLEYWRNLAGKKARRLHIVYGGTDSFVYKSAHVAPWNGITARLERA